MKMYLVEQVARNARAAIAAMLFILIATTVLFAFLVQNNVLKDLSINLGAGFIGSLLTIFLIDILQEKQKELRLAEAKSTAKAVVT